MKLLRLPSGRGVNVKHIQTWFFNDKHGTYLNITLIGGDTQYKDDDARALYAWLEANSTAIGEDGREVVHVKEPRVKEFLTALIQGDINATFRQRAIDTFDLTTDTLLNMAKDGAITSSREGLEITQRGRDYLELLSMEIT